MKSFRYIEEGILYVVTLDWVHDDYTRTTSLAVHSCWRFYPGRTAGEPISLTRMPWHGRQEIAELLNNSMP